MREHHALFHQHAGAIVSCVKEGKSGQANVLLHGVFSTESGNVVDLLEKLGEKYASSEEKQSAVMAQ